LRRYFFFFAFFFFFAATKITSDLETVFSNLSNQSGLCSDPADLLG